MRQLEIAAVDGRLEDEGWRLRHDGTRFWANVVITALREPGGTLLGYGKITRDLTERRTAEVTLRASEERFRLMVEGVQDYAILMLDAQGSVATWNSGAQRLKGYDADEIIGRHFSVFYPPEDVADHRPERELAVATARGRVQVEGWRIRRDGTRFWANVTITALRDAEGALRGFGKITRDLTERRAAELAVRASEERFRCFFDEARIGMVIIDLQGRYQRVNNAFCSIVGYAPEQLNGLPGETITHPDDLAGDRAILGSLLAGTQKSGLREKRFINASGHQVWVSINVSLVRGAGAQPLHFIAQIEDISERRSYETQLEYLADHDPLTGLLNRRSFERELTGHLTRIARYGAMGALLMIDLDHFKYFNDIHGHSVGDQLIARIAQALQARLRESDVLARFGGDEFAVLLPAEDELESQQVAEVLLQTIRGIVMPETGQNKCVTGSIGIARFEDSVHPSAEEMMVNADLAMYDAKDAGRDRWSRYRTEHHERPKIESRMKWAAQIKDAIANGGFELYAQPIVPLIAHDPEHYELLLRMRDRQGDLILPGSFLYVAERLGLIGEIDRWVSLRAIDMLAEHRALGRDLRFEVNLSGLSIGDEELLEVVKSRLRETGVPPDRLIFEITETAAIANIGRAVRFVERLSELGCGFALDDFGAGFGSFYYLKHLHFDYLKIDGEFVQHCAENETDRILIAAAVQIAHGMGKRTIAEFVTSDETAVVLTGLGVDFGQGYQLGRPAPLADHLALLDKRMAARP
jgi:diguanylate cyclase (GGDEF)-like protein/PAS domain S-box-containing protein